MGGLNRSSSRKQLSAEARRKARRASRARRFSKYVNPSSGVAANRAPLNALKDTQHSSPAKDRAAIIGSIILILACSIYIVFYTDTFHLRHIEVNETQYVSKDAITAAVEQYTTTSLFRVIPQNILPFIHTKSVHSHVEKHLGNPYAIQTMTIAKDYPQTLQVTVKERIPAITWSTQNTLNNQQQYYTVDRKGLVTEKLTADTIRKDLPRVMDMNRSSLGIGWHVISEEYISSIVDLHETLPQNNVPVESFILPPMVCEEQEYVAEKIFADEIASSETEEFREQKREIQDRFRRGEIDIDESLELLEEVKRLEFEQVQAISTKTPEKIEWAVVDKDVECDFVLVATDVYVQTTEEWGGVMLKIDTTRSLDEQIAQLKTGIQSGRVPKVETLQYIDVRIPERIYYRAK